jgi:hypothetical protein
MLITRVYGVWSSIIRPSFDSCWLLLPKKDSLAQAEGYGIGHLESWFLWHIPSYHHQYPVKNRCFMWNSTLHILLVSPDLGSTFAQQLGLGASGTGAAGSCDDGRMIEFDVGFHVKNLRQAAAIAGSATYLHICMYTFMYVYIYVYSNVHIHIYIYIFVYTSILYMS